MLTLHWVGVPALSTACRVGGADNGPAPPPTSSRPFNSLALIARDDVIAGVVNRNGLKPVAATAGREGKSRLAAIEPPHTGIPQPTRGEELWLNLSPAAAVVGVASHPAARGGAQGDPSSADGPGSSVAPTLKVLPLKLRDSSSGPQTTPRNMMSPSKVSSHQPHECVCSDETL